MKGKYVKEIITTIKCLALVGSLLLIVKASDYLLFGIGYSIGYISDLIDNPIILILLLALLIILGSIMMAFGKATGETFGANEGTKIFKNYKNKKNK